MLLLSGPFIKTKTMMMIFNLCYGCTCVGKKKEDVWTSRNEVNDNDNDYDNDNDDNDDYDDNGYHFFHFLLSFNWKQKRSTGSNVWSRLKEGANVGQWGMERAKCWLMQRFGIELLLYPIPWEFNLFLGLSVCLSVVSNYFSF